jgi:hypothetical protein
MKVDSPLRVQVPAPGDDRPSWVRVGVIAVVGFAIGVGWPRLVGARIGPSLPEDTAATTASPASRAEAPAPATAGAAAPISSVSSTPASPAAAPGGTSAASPPAVTVNHGVLLTCRDEGGQTLRGVTACGGLGGFDAIVQPKLRRLASCPAATSTTSGKLSVVFNLDFNTHRVATDVGKSSTVADGEGFATCVKGAFQGVSLGALDHQNPRYTIAYSVTFAPTEHSPAFPSPPSGPPDGVPVATVTEAPTAKPTSDDGNVEVAWDVAIVRDAPHTGAVLARLPRGTKVRVESNQDGWYKIGYSGPATGEGWVYRGAIGR